MERLVCGASYPENESPNMEMMLIDSSKVDLENNETELGLEARTVADKIYKLIFEEKLKVKGDNGERVVTYGDIAILLRSPKGETRRAVTFVNELNQSGIPTISEEKNSFFDMPEVKVLINFMSIIDNPVQDIPLLSVLMSPMFSFSADDVAKLRISDRKSPLYIALKNSIDEKCVKFIELLEKLRTLSVTTTVDMLITIILSATGFDCIAMAGDKYNVNNIYLLQSYARSYAENGYKTLTAFMNYINRMKEKGTVLNSVSDINDSSRNAVRVMSIHASKGLEFPVCFICSTSTKFNLKDTNNDLVLNSDNGIGLKIKEDIIKYDTTQRKILSLMQKDIMISEEMRILYVALTRAKERLIITSVNKEPKNYLSNLESKIASYPISSYVVKNMNSYSDWLFSCALSNPSCNIRVNSEPDYTYYKDSYRPWKVQIVDEKTEAEKELESENEPEVVEENTEINEEFLNEFISRVNFEYKNKPLSSLPQKVSASEFSHRDNGVFNKILRKPSFMNDEDKSGAEKGTAFHNFMERCDIKNAVENCEKEARRLCESGYLTKRQVQLLDYEKLEKFLSGKLISRVLSSGEYYREFQFTVKIDASDYNPELKESFFDEKIVMQGAVDLVFIENGEAVIVDYKTDRVKDLSKLAELYHKQVELYKSAIEKCTDYKVKEIIIYSVHLNEEIIM
ncbi:MAG: PD-(D/E)XK nuclease family protein [Ruminococcus sp.]|nr:PD-(D/E)XK nuclease family protein [Ruminococcus sp.]